MRNRQPLELAQLKGATRHDPQRYRGSIAKHPDPVGEPPALMSDNELLAWQEVVDRSLPGVLTKTDAFFVEFAARHLAEYRENPPEFPAARFRNLMSVLSKLGFSPSDRQAFSIESPPEDNPFNQF